jgi:hypothetical protein
MAQYSDHGRSHIRALAKAFLHTEDILRLHEDGFSVDDISLLLSITPRMIKRVLNGKNDPNPHVVGSLPWTQEQDAMILTMRNRQGRMWAPIGEVVGRPAAEVTERYKYLMNCRRRQAEISQRSVGTCMTCHGQFVKESRWNRRCSACKALDNGLPDHFTIEASQRLRHAGMD